MTRGPECRQALAHLGWSQPQAARHCRVTLRTVSTWCTETGLMPGPAALLLELAVAMPGVREWLEENARGPSKQAAE